MAVGPVRTRVRTHLLNGRSAILFVSPRWGSRRARVWGPFVSQACAASDLGYRISPVQGSLGRDTTGRDTTGTEYQRRAVRSTCSEAGADRSQIAIRRLVATKPESGPDTFD